MIDWATNGLVDLLGLAFSISTCVANMVRLMCTALYIWVEKCSLFD